MTYTPVGSGQTKAYRAASYLRRTFTEWTADPAQPGQKFSISYLRWVNFDARTAYWLICDIWKFPKEA